MPMLYGEGTKAFIRLQEEIIKTSDDHSIFAWHTNNVGTGSVLAPSPKCFAKSSDITSTAALSSPEPYAMTNCRDISADKELMPHARLHSDASRIGIFVKLTPRDRQYTRISIDGAHLYQINLLAYSDYHQKRKRILILQTLNMSDDIEMTYGFVLRTLSSVLFPIHTNFYSKTGLSRIVHSGKTSTPDERVVKVITLPVGQQGTVGTFRLWDTKAPVESNTVALVRFGFDFDFNPLCILYGTSSELWYMYCKDQDMWLKTQAGQRVRVSNEYVKSGGKEDYGWKDDVPFWAHWHRKGEYYDVLAHIDNDYPLDTEVSRSMDMSPLQTWSERGVCVVSGSRKSGVNIELQHINVRVEIALGHLHSASKAWFIDIFALGLPGYIECLRC
ncbi:hypothetical protein LTR05_001101 [Lithohypha guttulata]|uniref:DUF8212 domain-containing protein n=1 Tax=Lithohypha guttulata TaxID=1690604 RepID=A0AAN7T637_9EURO|nr:hypothetical protein LTR05_001101 [Lithohypha guttulata]